MKVLIITTSVVEYEGILIFFEEDDVMPDPVFHYSKHGLNVDFINSGAGNFNLIYKLTQRLTEKEYDLVINAGICGTYNQKIQLGSVFRVRKDRFADSGAFDEDRFRDIFDLGLMNENDFPFQNKWLFENPGEYEKYFNDLKLITGLTVNQIPLSEKILKEIRGNTDPVIESMEGAGFFFVCRNENRHCLQIRSVSNYALERDKSKWKINLAIENLGMKLKQVLDEI